MKDIILGFIKFRIASIGLLITTLLLLIFKVASAQTLVEQANTKIDSLNVLISNAESKGIDVLREQLTVNVAEVFLFYADWDENHVSENTSKFQEVTRYKDNAQQMAENLPDMERRDVIQILDESIETLNLVIDGVINRQPTPKIDWSQATLDGDQITYNSRPVFLNDYTWKPQMAGEIDLDLFFGKQDGYYYDQNKVDSNKKVKPFIINELKAKASGTLGFIFLGNKGVPAWSEQEYGPGFDMKADRYTVYDIDNPGAKEINSLLFSQCIPYMAGKKYSELGYMLCNEPHFYTTKTGNKNDWASSSVTEFTIQKFRTWLSQKHASIQDLNQLWGTFFSGFEQVEIEVPIDNNLQGTPMWYDWQTFNNYRVTEWYKWMKSEIRKYDTNAKVHLKVMPNLWTENKRGHGLDMEALTEMSDIIGNDFGSENSYMWGGPKDWEHHYALEWREFCMGHDFFKSISPDKSIYNTELHYLSKGSFRDVNLDPNYARACYWLSHSLGATANQVWFWPRLNDGGIKSNSGKGYAGSNIHQPRVTREVEATIMDLNSFSEEIMAMQRQRKPLRIFYSETSAQNKPNHMDDVFELYEELVFEGVPIGFATKDIIAKQSNRLWDAILIYKTPYVTQAERDTLQAFLNRGGIIFMDGESIKKDEYKRNLALLNPGNGQIIYTYTLEQLKNKSFELLDNKGLLPGVSIEELNSGGHKGCFWKCIENENGKLVVSVVNLGKTNATLSIKLKNAKIGTVCIDLLTGNTITSNPTLKPYDVYFVEISDKDVSNNHNPIKPNGKDIGKIYPNPTIGVFNVELFEPYNKVQLTIHNTSGVQFYDRTYNSTDKIFCDIRNLPNGAYIVGAKSQGLTQNFIVVKNQ